MRSILFLAKFQDEHHHHPLNLIANGAVVLETHVDGILDIPRANIGAEVLGNWEPTHIDHYIELGQSEMYGEPFGIPHPEEQVFVSWFEGGEVFRGGNCWTRGSGRIFYFSPGHEAYPIYHHPAIQRVIYNAVRWARPLGCPADTPRHVLVEEARERITPRGPVLHDAAGGLR